MSETRAREAAKASALEKLHMRECYACREWKRSREFAAQAHACKSCDLAAYEKRITKLTV